MGARGGGNLHLAFQHREKFFVARGNAFGKFGTFSDPVYLFSIIIAMWMSTYKSLDRDKKSYSRILVFSGNIIVYNNRELKSPFSSSARNCNFFNDNSFDRTIIFTFILFIF